jgi:branched-chain amino acid transport system ATP-binding protein
MTRGHLAVTLLCSGYGPTQIVHDVSFELRPGEAVAVLGRNGAGKTTLVNTIAGRLRARSGGIRFDGAAVERWAPSARCRAGLGLVPQDRQVFGGLTVEENLAVADLRRSWTAARVYALFPRLAERRSSRGRQLSGGEQQMLAIGRALMGDPACLLLDEPFEGLAPVIVDALLDAFTRLRAEAAMSIVIVEQSARLAVELADHAVLIERGRVRTQGDRADLMARWEEVETLLSVA